MAEITRNSILAIKEESTEGTPVVPSGATDFTAIQDDLSISPSFSVLENAEIKASLAPSKSILGLEAPTASLSHYLRHSGVEGQAPDYNLLLKGAFGSVASNGTEHSTTSSSTTSVIKLASGGSSHERGTALLLKDGTNGYSIRPVHSRSTNDLTLGFNVATAPASGVATGKAVTYSPANSDHPSLSLFHYVANAGALQAVAGAKVTEFSFSAAAGELINGSFSLEGTKYYYDPINITATDTKLDFTDSTPTTLAATVSASLYRSPHDLAAALQTSMNAQGSVDTFTVTYNDSGASAGKFTIASSGSVFTLKWNTGANTANTIGDKIGFSVAADDTGALTYTSDNAQSWAAGITPSYDSADPVVGKANEVLLGDALDTTCFCASSISFSLSNTKSNINCLCAETGVQGSAFSGRAVTIQLTAYLERHDAEKFYRFKENQETRFCYNFGSKSGGNWVAGKCASLYLPTCTISSFEIADQDGFAVLNMTLTAFADSSGNGECYLNFL